MNDKIRSILPVSASRAERVVDSTAGDMLAEIAVCLIRYVKNPDLCPAELLPWLAWEMSVDTWNEHWTEAEKRAAIKRAAYIHRHRGTKAALNESLADSPFRSQIVEWYEQAPPGDPYTFRLNVEQKDLPVLINDHQDLKHAVLRAKNLRSWFSVHIYGSSRGNGFGYGYVTATEKLKNRILPSEIQLEPDNLRLLPGEEVSVKVTVLPRIADDRSFTVQPEDEGVAAISISGDIITLTGTRVGHTTVIVSTVNGVIARLPVNVVSVVQVIVRADNVSRPLFFIDAQDNDFTIDYGDGVDCRDYVIEAGMVKTTRELPVGEEITLTIKGAESVTFYSSSALNRPNPLLEIIRVSGTRRYMSQFANLQNTLRKIHAGAFDNLPRALSFSGAFRGCSALTELPENLFAQCAEVSSWNEAFYGCTGLTDIPVLFAPESNARTLSKLFYGCSKIVRVPEALFAGMDDAWTFESAFYGCSKMVNAPAIPARSLQSLYMTFSGCSELAELPVIWGKENESHALSINLSYAFYDCRSLTVIPENWLDVIRHRMAHVRGIFNRCSSIRSVPSRLFAGANNLRTADNAFDGCRGITCIGEGVFEGCRSLSEINYAFHYCSALETIGNRVFADCVSLRSMASTFANSSIVNAGEELFAGCTSLTLMESVFVNCRKLVMLPDSTFRGCTSLKSVPYLFSGCSALTRIQEALFSDCSLTGGGGMFRWCSSLTQIPSGLINHRDSNAGIAEMFRECTSLAMDINEIFPHAFTERRNLSYVFYRCSNVTGSKSEFLAKFPEPISVAYAFDYCPLLTD
ncbi:TPA: phage tail protein I [Escherichia coli]|nr:phage tail protein I [Escherichia coli]